MAAWDLTSILANTSSPTNLTSSLSGDQWKDNHSGAALYDDGSGNHHLLIPVNKDDSGNNSNPGIKVYDLDANYNITATASSYIDLNNFEDVEAIVALGSGKFAIAEEGLWDFTVFNYSTFTGSTLSKSSLPAGGYIINMQAAGGGPSLPTGDNSGIEGLAYDPADGTYGTFYAAEEFISSGNKTPRIWRVPGPTPPATPQTVNATANAINPSSLPSGFIDISDLHFQQVGTTKHLFFASEERATS